METLEEIFVQLSEEKQIEQYHDNETIKKEKEESREHLQKILQSCITLGNISEEEFNKTIENFSQEKGLLSGTESVPNFTANIQYFRSQLTFAGTPE